MNHRPPRTSCQPASASSNLDASSEAAYRVITTEFEEIPIIRISRSYAELVALELAIDIHPSTLGAVFPDDMAEGSLSLMEDPEEITRVMEAIELWMQAIIERINVAETPSLAEFIRPTEVLDSHNLKSR